MTTKHKPATPLPWEPSEKYTPIAPYIQSEQDEDYACHTANAYPRLIEALQHTLALSNPRSEGQRYQYDKAYNLLRELGE